MIMVMDLNMKVILRMELKKEMVIVFIMFRENGLYTR